jgi:hypothetical protein
VPHFWYLPTLGFSLWPCAALIVVFIPVSIYHERNWRRTLAAYAQVRRDAGAEDLEWPSAELSHAMGVQLWLVLTATLALATMTGVAVWAAMLWPHTPPGFELPINYYDLPYLWGFVVVGTAAVVAGIAIAVDVGRSPWRGVARKVRRAIYAKPPERERLFALALAADPGIPPAENAAQLAEKPDEPAEPLPRS